MHAAQEYHGHRCDDVIPAAAADWWAGRRELRSGSAWEVPFPPRAAETVRVLHDAGAESGAEMWYAALIRPRAVTAYIEVHSQHGPVAALVSLYEHVC